MIRRLTITLLLLLAILFVFAQSAWLIAVPEPIPQLSEWLVRYKWTSSIKTFGIALLMICAAVWIWRFSSRMSYYFSFLVILLATWLYMGHELWSYYVEMPKRFAGLDRPFPSYFSFRQPLFAIPRMLWHICIPIVLVLTLILIRQKEASNKLAHTTHEPL